MMIHRQPMIYTGNRPGRMGIGRGGRMGMRTDLVALQNAKDFDRDSPSAIRRHTDAIPTATRTL